MFAGLTATFKFIDSSHSSSLYVLFVYVHFLLLATCLNLFPTYRSRNVSLPVGIDLASSSALASASTPGATSTANIDESNNNGTQNVGGQEQDVSVSVPSAKGDQPNKMAVDLEGEFGSSAATETGATDEDGKTDLVHTLIREMVWPPAFTIVVFICHQRYFLSFFIRILSSIFYMYLYGFCISPDTYFLTGQSPHRKDHVAPQLASDCAAFLCL
jgi:hypothetical protein